MALRGLRTSRSRGSTWRLPLGHAHPSVASAAKKYTFLTTTPQKRILFCGSYDEKVYFFEAQAREARRDRTTTHGNEPLVARHELDKPRPRPRTRRHGAVRLSTRHPGRHPAERSLSPARAAARGEERRDQASGGEADRPGRPPAPHLPRGLRRLARQRPLYAGPVRRLIRSPGGRPPVRLPR